MYVYIYIIIYAHACAFESLTLPYRPKRLYYTREKLYLQISLHSLKQKHAWCENVRMNGNGIVGCKVKCRDAKDIDHLAPSKVYNMFIFFFLRMKINIICLYIC